MLITNATGLFAPGAWDEVRRHWTASRLMEDAHLEKARDSRPIAFQDLLSF